MKNLSRNSKYFVAIVGLGALILLVLGFNSRISELRRLSTEADSMSERVSMLEQTQIALEMQIAYATSDAAVEEWAYEEARWIREGDFLIAPISPDDGATEPEPIRIPAQSTTRNWEVWKALFFDLTSP